MVALGKLPQVLVAVVLVRLVKMPQAVVLEKMEETEFHHPSQAQQHSELVVEAEEATIVLGQAELVAAVILQIQEMSVTE